MKKGDYLIIGICALLSVVLFFAFPKAAGKTVTVKQNNKVVYTGKLTDDNTVKLDGNEVIIKSGEVYMKNADCKNKICIHTGKIRKAGESIICLPNKVAVMIK